MSIIKLIFAAAMAMGSATATAAEFFYVEGAETLNVRSGPDAAYSKVTELPDTATSIENLGCTSIGYFWCRVRYQGIEGWASGRYLRDFRVPVGSAPIDLAVLVDGYLACAKKTLEEKSGAKNLDVARAEISSRCDNIIERIRTHLNLAGLGDAWLSRVKNKLEAMMAEIRAEPEKLVSGNVSSLSDPASSNPPVTSLPDPARAPANNASPARAVQKNEGYVENLTGTTMWCVDSVAFQSAGELGGQINLDDIMRRFKKSCDSPMRQLVDAVGIELASTVVMTEVNTVTGIIRAGKH